MHGLTRRSHVAHPQPTLRSICAPRTSEYTYVLYNEDGNSLLVPSIQTKLLEIHKDGDGDASFQLESDSLPHAYAQTTKTYYKH
ncbi:hypothetical protein Tco_0726350 [Tanacetum coccineum]|uniref:Uncharacterized protein n=1 Tax=Tanacetum coccineum TaxID=301880 RepID=A0ABQ4YFD0_9ASTR